VRIGLFRRGTNEIVDLAPCRVQRPVLQRAIERLRGWLERHRLAQPEGPVFYLDLREADGGRCHVTLVVSGERLDPDTLPLDDLTRSLPGVAGVAINEGDTESSYPMGPVTRVVRGTETFPAQLPMSRGEPLFLEVPAGGFFQVAPSALPAVHDRMAAHLAGCTVLFDLYCGVGVHGIAVVLRSTCTARVRGIEESVPLVEAARNNAARLGVSARYDPAAVEDRLAESMRESPPDGVILNPGRAGCRRSVVEILNAGPAARIAYLSCNPDTLARDLSGLLRSGFRARAIVPVDLMPQTDHVEVLALLSRDGNAG
jgi:tRNA/tmRNA/rRNA uracil-C5-methylase (TrmA/RlmC/RlmD family)